MKIVRISAVWCGGCLVMNKIWNEVKNEYPDIEVIKYDYDMDNDIVKELNVGDLLPVTIFYNNDQEITRLIGEKNKKAIIDAINNL
ncbi:MAG: thioredoxin family protein [Ignavibacteriales bacterium]